MLNRFVRLITLPFRLLAGPTEVLTPEEAKAANWIAAARAYVYGVWPELIAAIAIGVTEIAGAITVTDGVVWFLAARCLVALLNPIGELARRKHKHNRSEV